MITQETLDDLDAERRSAAVQAQQQGQTAVHTSWVMFRVAGHWLAVEATSVEEISDQLAVLPIPRPPAHIPGLMNVRGHAVPLLDIAAFLDLRSDPQTPTRTDEGHHLRVIIARSSDMRVGLMCDQVRSLESIEAAAMHTPAGLEGFKIAAFARAQTEMATSVVTLLNLPKLLEAARVQR